jgi:hypothetical protein
VQVDGDRAAHRPQSAALALLALVAGGELLADNAQGQELVALHAQDHPQALDVSLAVEAVATPGAARGQQLLVLQVADLGDRDVVELLAEDLADGADRQRLAGPRGAVASRAGAPAAAVGREAHLNAPGS